MFLLATLAASPSATELMADVRRQIDKADSISYLCFIRRQRVLGPAGQNAYPVRNDRVRFYFRKGSYIRIDGESETEIRTPTDTWMVDRRTKTGTHRPPNQEFLDRGPYELLAYFSGVPPKPKVEQVRWGAHAAWKITVWTDPKKGEVNYVVIDAKTHLPLASYGAFSHTIYTFSYEEFKINPKLPASLFKLDPKGWELTNAR